jgi:site-specific recombinase XerC
MKRVALLKHVLNSAGNAPYKSITKAEIVAGRERRAKTPAQANNFLAVMRALFKWAVDNNFLDASPTDGVRDLKRPNAAPRRSRLDGRRLGAVSSALATWHA